MSISLSKNKPVAFQNKIKIHKDSVIYGLALFKRVSFFAMSNRLKVFSSKILFPTSCLSVHPCVVRCCACVRRLAPIPAGESQDVNNESCSICLRGDKNDVRVTP